MRRSYPLLHHVLILLPLAVVLALLWGFIGSERQVFEFFRDYRAEHADLTLWIGWYSLLGNPFFYLLYAGIFFWSVKTKRPDITRLVLAYALAQLAVALVLGRIVKIGVGRPRPMTGGPFMPLSLDTAHHSFVSGHTTEFLGATLPLATRYRKIALSLFFGLALAAMGFSRIYLSMHHPTDVAGGMVLGSLSGYLAWRLMPVIAAWRDRSGRNKGKLPWRGT